MKGDVNNLIAVNYWYHHYYKDHRDYLLNRFFDLESDPSNGGRIVSTERAIDVFVLKKRQATTCQTKTRQAFIELYTGRHPLYRQYPTLKTHLHQSGFYVPDGAAFYALGKNLQDQQGLFYFHATDLDRLQAIDVEKQFAETERLCVVGSLFGYTNIRYSDARHLLQHYVQSRVRCFLPSTGETKSDVEKERIGTLFTNNAQRGVSHIVESQPRIQTLPDRSAAQLLQHEQSMRGQSIVQVFNNFIQRRTLPEWHVGEFAFSDSAVEHENCLMLLGDAGMGKSSALTMLYLNARIPTVENIPRHPGLTAYLIKISNQLPKQLFSIRDAHGGDVSRVILLLDAYDECPDSYSEGLAFLESILQRTVAHHSVVIASRINYLPLERFKERRTNDPNIKPIYLDVTSQIAPIPVYFVQPFDYADQRSYIHSVFANQPLRAEAALQLVQRIQNPFNRPFILFYIDLILEDNHLADYSLFSVMHSLMKQWCQREIRRLYAFESNEGNQIDVVRSAGLFGSICKLLADYVSRNVFISMNQWILLNNSFWVDQLSGWRKMTADQLKQIATDTRSPSKFGQPFGTNMVDRGPSLVAKMVFHRFNPDAAKRFVWVPIHTTFEEFRADVEENVKERFDEYANTYSEVLPFAVVKWIQGLEGYEGNQLSAILSREPDGRSMLRLSEAGYIFADRRMREFLSVQHALELPYDPDDPHYNAAPIEMTDFMWELLVQHKATRVLEHAKWGLDFRHFGEMASRSTVDSVNLTHSRFDYLSYVSSFINSDLSYSSFDGARVVAPMEQSTFIGASFCSTDFIHESNAVYIIGGATADGPRSVIRGCDFSNALFYKASFPHDIHFVDCVFHGARFVDCEWASNPYHIFEDCSPSLPEIVSTLGEQGIGPSTKPH